MNQKIWTSCVACGQRVTGDSIHTCSPQLKQLTDEEMMKAEYEFMYWNRSLDKPLVKIASELGVFKQAVAILRKAQEK